MEGKYVNAFGNSSFTKTDSKKYQEMNEKMIEANQLVIDEMKMQNDKLNLYLGSIKDIEQNTSKINNLEVKTNQIDDIWIKLRENENKLNTMIDLMRNLNNKVNSHEKIFYKINEILRRWREPILHSIKNLKNIFTTLGENRISMRFIDSSSDIPYLQDHNNFNIMKDYS